MNGLNVVLCVLSFSPTVSAGSHSLWTLITFIIGETPFPEFSAVVMLDDVQVGYYDSTIKRVIRRGYKHSEEEVDDAEQRDAILVFGYLYNSIKDRAFYLKHHFNHTEGIHSQQRLVGCELLDNGEPGQTISKGAFNGLCGDEIDFNMQQSTLQSNWIWPAGWGKLQQNYIQFINEHVCHPICIKTLRGFLNTEKNRVMRKVKPRVRLLQKAHPDSGGVQVSCLATGFYPRHLNLTLLRDGQPVAERQITGGVLLPNGDETYQMRKTMEVSAEELERHLYTCTASHLSLDNKLNITLENEPGSDTVVIVSSVLVLLLVCVIGPTAAFFMWRRRRAGMGSKSSLQSSYTAASSTEPSETSEDTSS